MGYFTFFSFLFPKRLMCYAHVFPCTYPMDSLVCASNIHVYTLLSLSLQLYCNFFITLYEHTHTHTYTYIHIHIHTQCERTTALESLHRLLFEEPVKIAIMGSGCSPATEPTAEIDHYYNLTHVRDFAATLCLSVDVL